MNGIESIKRVLGIHLTEWAIAGGNPRDAKHGIGARDTDIIVVDNGEVTNMIRAFHKLGYQYTVFDNTTGNTYEDGRITHVLKLTEFNVDIIVWHPDYESIQAIVDNFDFNINQYIVDDDNEIAFVGKNEGTLEMLDGYMERCENVAARGVYMIEKAEQLGWIVPDELRKIFPSLEGMFGDDIFKHAPEPVARKVG